MRDSDPWSDLAEIQHGVVSRAQLLALGLTPAQARRNVTNGRWMPLLPGVYASFTGRVGDLAEVWAAVLYAGDGAAASHLTALWLTGVLDERPSAVHVAIPAGRQVRQQPGVRLHRTRATGIVHPAARPPRTRIEWAVLDQADVTASGGALDLVLRATQRRLTTAERLLAALGARARHRHRTLLTDLLLADVSVGVQSPLERRYLREVERRHQIPPGRRNSPERTAGGGWLYRDVLYTRWRVVVELDGREAHPDDRAFRDHRRDNAAALAGDVVLRYGWREVVGNPCGVAEEVAAILRNRGWPGSPTACGPGCRLTRVA